MSVLYNLVYSLSQLMFLLSLSLPSTDSILDAICQGVSLSENVSLSEIADLTPGYVGCDLKTLVSITNACALNRVICQYLKEGRGAPTTTTAEDGKVEGKFKFFFFFWFWGIDLAVFFFLFIYKYGFYCKIFSSAKCQLRSLLKILCLCYGI